MHFRKNSKNKSKTEKHNRRRLFYTHFLLSFVLFKLWINDPVPNFQKLKIDMSVSFSVCICAKAFFPCFIFFNRDSTLDVYINKYKELYAKENL